MTDVMTDDDAMVLVSRYAASLGLHGVMILSSKCEDCGNCHDFAFVSDLKDGNSRELLGHFVRLMGRADTEIDRIPIFSPKKEH